MIKMSHLLFDVLLLAGCSFVSEADAQVIMPNLDKPAGETVYNSPEVKATMADAKTGRKWEDSLNVMVKFPEEIKKTGMQGRVIYRVIVEKDGRVGRVEPMMMMLTDVTRQKLGVQTDEEANRINTRMKQTLTAEGLRCVKLLPPCKPARQEGKNVRSFVTVSASFRP